MQKELENDFIDSEENIFFKILKENEIRDVILISEILNNRILNPNEDYFYI
jgi:hypothetical protein